MRSTLRFIGSCIVLIGLAGGLPLRAAQQWIKVQTEEFAVVTDAGERDAIEFGVNYTAFRQVLREYFKLSTKLPRSTILLFRRQELMAPYLPAPTRENTVMTTFAAGVDGAELLAISLDGNRSQALERMYELDTGWVLGRFGYFLPVWVSQGAGQVFCSLQINKGKAVIGNGPDRVSSAWRRNGLIAWPDFFSTSTGTLTGGFQGQSWALMHRLLLEGDGGRERFETLAKKLRTTPGLQATESVLGIPATEFDKEIRRHFSGKSVTREFPFDEAKARAALTVVPVEEFELRIHLANLLIAAGKTREGEAQFAAVQATMPDAPIVKEWMARRAQRDKDPQEAARLYREAIAAGSRNPNAYLASASLRMTASGTGNLDREGSGGSDLEESIAEIRRALELNPGSAEAYQALGRAFFLKPKPTEADLEELNRGVVPGGDGGQVQRYRAMLLHRLKREEEYVADLRQLATLPGIAPGPKKFALEKLDKIAEAEFLPVQNEVGKLAAAKRYPEAHELIAKARAASTDKTNIDGFDRMRDWLNEHEAWENVRTLFGERKLVEGRTAAQKFLAAYPKSQAAAEARRLDAAAAKEIEAKK